eukprot:6637711-Alexandrium_andersonii.AAC.1
MKQGVDEEDDVLRLASEAQRAVASLASPQRRQLGAQQLQQPAQHWQLQRIRAQDAIIAELRA